MACKQVINKPKNNERKWRTYTGNIIVVVRDNQIEAETSIKYSGFSYIIGEVQHTCSDNPQTTIYY